MHHFFGLKIPIDLMTVEWNGISVLMSLNNLSPLVANFKISYMNTAYAHTAKYQPIWTDLGAVSAICNWHKWHKCYFCVSVTKVNSAPWWPISKSAR